MGESINTLLLAPSRETLSVFITACFRFRNNIEELSSSKAVAGLSLDPEQSLAVSIAGSKIVSDVLYNSADIGSMDAVVAHLPSAVDPRLKQLLCEVSLCIASRAVHVPNTRLTPMLFALANLCWFTYVARGGD